LLFLQPLIAGTSVDIQPTHKSISMRRSIGGRKSIGGGRRSIGSGPRSPGGEGAGPGPEKTAAALRDMYSKINDIIQLSSENKINPKNAWNLGVDMDSLMDSALDEGIVEDKENERAIAKQGGEVMRRRRSGGFARAGVNFQKASVKLDASVKIYSARVDDTHSTSFRILENLNRSGQADPDSGSDAPKAKSAAGDKATSNKLCIAKTLEKSPESLNAPPAAELQVDPSFHKMSSLFDEGGAEGMLLFNLSLEPRGGCTVAFGDTHDRGTPAAAAKAAAAAAGASPASASSSPQSVVSPFQLLDVSALCARVDRAVEELLLAQGGALSGHGGVAALELCPSLAAFRDETAQLTGKPYALGAPTPYKPASAAASPAAGAAASSGSPGGAGGGAADEHDWCADDDDDDSYGDDNGDAADLALDFGDEHDGGYDGDDASFAGPGQASPTANSRGPKGAGTAAGQHALEAVLQLDGGAFFAAEDGNDYAFFDAQKLGSLNLWAGATHWKFGQQKRAVPSKPDRAASGSATDHGDALGGGGGDDEPTSAAGRKKARKGALAVDFCPLPDPDDEAMLESKVLALLALPVAKKASAAGPKTAKAKAAALAKADAALAAATQLSATALAKTAAAAVAGAYALPADAGLAPRDLRRLFLRPDAVVNLQRGGGVRWGLGGGGGFEQPASCGYGGEEDGGFGDGGYGYDAANDDSFGDDEHGGPGFAMASARGADDADVDASRMLAPDRKVREREERKPQLVFNNKKKTHAARIPCESHCIALIPQQQ
jgi:condensin complex subunit 2